MKQTYSVREVASVLGLSAESAGELVRLVFAGPRDVLSFQDLVLLRAAKQLSDRRVSKQRIAQTLSKLRETVADDQPLSAFTLHKAGKELVVGLGEAQWNAESGQGVLDLQAKVTRPATWIKVPPRDAEALFNEGVRREETDPSAAADVYSEAVAANPQHADAHVNLGRLLHQRGHLREAEAHYVAALVSRPEDSTATFNLAVVLEDQGRHDEAIARYTDALRLDPHCVDAYFNLARLYEKKGEKLAAIRHLKDYRRLTRH